MDQGSADGPTGEPKPASVLTGKHKVKWQDAEREMDIEELVGLAIRGQDADQTLAAARKLVGEDYPKVQEIALAYQRMTPQQRQAFDAMLNGSPSTNAGDQTDEDLLAELEELGTEPKEQQNGDVQQLLARLSRIESHIQAQSEEAAKQKVGDHIDRLIGQYPDLNASSGGKAMARQAIMDSLLINPSQKVEDLVARYAGDFLKMVREQREAVVKAAGEPAPRSSVPSGDKDYQPLRPERTPTGDDLMRGNVRKMLQDKFLSGDFR